MDAVDLEVKIKFLEKSQEKLMDLYLDALVRLANIEKYIQSVNINFGAEKMEYSPPTESEAIEARQEAQEPSSAQVIYKRKYSNEEAPSIPQTQLSAWDSTVENYD